MFVFVRNTLSCGGAMEGGLGLHGCLGGGFLLGVLTSS